MSNHLIPIGTRVYNRGDMANPEHWGTIIAWVEPGRYQCGQYLIERDDREADRPTYWVAQNMVHDVDAGNGATRIVTEEAHRAWREQQLAAFQASVQRRA